MVFLRQTGFLSTGAERSKWKLHTQPDDKFKTTKPQRRNDGALQQRQITAFFRQQPDRQHQDADPQPAPSGLCQPQTSHQYPDSDSDSEIEGLTNDFLDELEDRAGVNPRL